MTRKMLCLAALGVALALTVCAAEADELTLVADGRSEYSIILSKQASESEQWAAAELAGYLKQMSGAELEVVRADAAPARAIVLGDGPAARALGVSPDPNRLGTDGYAIKTVGDRIVIVGSRKCGTMYGAFTLLESLGVRWWTPGETHVPQRNTVTLAPIDRLDVPRLKYRDLLFRQVWDEPGRIWMAHNKLNGLVNKGTPAKYGGQYEYAGGGLGHTLMNLLTRHEITITPEMMSQDARGRRAPPGSRTHQLCFSSNAAVEAMTQAAVAEYRARPDIHFVVVGQEDGYNYCRCETCQALAKAEESQAAPLLQFINRVAEAVEKQVPGAEIATNAYVWSRKPPRTVRPRDNVRIVLATYECGFADPLATSTVQPNVEFRKDLEAWNRLAPDRLIIWDYVTNFTHYLMPHPNLDVLTPNVKYLADHGVVGMIPQGQWDCLGGEFTQLRRWVLAKAMWDPSVDNEATIREFVEGYYGPAAPAILKYIDIVHRFVRKDRTWVLNIYRHLNVPYIAPDIVAEAEAALRQADEAVADQSAVLQRRVRHAHMPIWYLLAKFGPGSKMWRATESQVGQLDMARVAEQFGRVAADEHINEVGEGQDAKAFFEWLADYGKLVAAKGVPLPQELIGKDPNSFRLIQACQMDRGAPWYTRDEGATDGWAVKPPQGRQVLHYLSDTNDYTPGKTYKAFVRARAEGVAADANAVVWTCSLRNRPAVAVTTDQFRDGKWHTFEIGTVKPSGSGFGLTSGWLYQYRGRAESIFIDCFWIVEQP